MAAGYPVEMPGDFEFVATNGIAGCPCGMICLCLCMVAVVEGEDVSVLFPSLYFCLCFAPSPSLLYLCLCLYFSRCSWEAEEKVAVEYGEDFRPYPYCSRCLAPCPSHCPSRCDSLSKAP